jgi:hypothetical protein
MSISLSTDALLKVLNILDNLNIDKLINTEFISYLGDIEGVQSFDRKFSG